MSTKNSKLIQAKKFNAKLYPFYRMISCDLIFYYAIKFIFLTQIKGLSASDIVLVASFYGLFRLLLQIPCTILMDRLGKRKALIIGNIANSIYLLLFLLCFDFSSLMMAEFICAFAFDLKTVCEPSLLTDSLPNTKKRGNIFSELDGKGLSGYYVIDAISSILSGFLFAINGYIPIVLCFLFTIVSIFLSCRFKDIDELEPKPEFMKKVKISDSLHHYLKDLKSSFKFIFRSKRLKSLILFYGIFSGFMLLMDNYEKSLLEDLAIPSQYFGIIFFILTFLSAIAAKKQNVLHDRLRNKTLSGISLSYTIACIVAGLVVILNVPSASAVVIIVFMYAIRYIDNGSLNVLIKRYLGNFASSEMSPKIYSANYIVQSICRMLIGLLGSFFLSIMSTSYSIVLLGCTFTLIMLMILHYMKGRVGLKPEQYTKRDIEFTEVK